MRPTAPGKFMAREISVDLGGSMLFSRPYEVTVVAGVPNPRNHALLVKTGVTHPKYKSLDCFDWGPVPSPADPVPQMLPRWQPRL